MVNYFKSALLFALCGCTVTTHTLDINTNASYELNCVTFSRHCDDDDCWVEYENQFTINLNAGYLNSFTEDGAKCTIQNKTDGLTTGSFIEVEEDHSGEIEKRTISSGLAKKSGQFFKIEFGETL